MLLLTYTPTMKTVLSVMKCHAPYPGSKERWLHVDQRVQCRDGDGAFTEAYLLHFSVSLGLILLYVYLLPLALLSVVSWYASARSEAGRRRLT